jgi:hypothetical protein
MARTFIIGTSFVTLASAKVTNYPFTLAAWFNLASLPGANQNIFVWNTTPPSSNDSFGIAWDHVSGKFLGYVVNSSGTSDTTNPAGTALSTGVWYPGLYVCTSATSRTMYIYQGGVLNTSSQTTNIVFGGTTNQGRIGKFSNNASDLSGSVAEVAIWNAALTATEVQAYCLGIRAYTIRPKSLVGYWPIDGLSSPEPDLSGNAVNGTLTGSPAFAFGPPYTMLSPRTPRWLEVAAAPIFNPAWAKPFNQVVSGGRAT